MHRLKFLFLAAVLFLAGCPRKPLTAPPTTSVSATITDTAGIPYANATVSIYTANPPSNILGYNCVANGCVIQTSSTGAFTISLPSIGQNWVFNVSTPGIPPPFGTGPQNFQSSISISGGSQSITTTLNAATKPLTNLGTGAVAGTTGTFTGAVSGTTGTFTGALSAADYLTASNCQVKGTAASPSAVACGAAPAGAFTCDPAATGATCVVSTTAVTANSEITVQQVTYLNTLLTVTCNTASVLPSGPLVTAISAGTSFTISLGTVMTNPGCFVYTIDN